MSINLLFIYFIHDLIPTKFSTNHDVTFKSFIDKDIHSSVSKISILIIAIPLFSL